MSAAAWMPVVWTQLWQVAALVVAVGLLTRVACRRRPHLAYLFWMLVIVKSVTPPFWDSPLGVFSWTQRETATVSTAVSREDLEERREGAEPPGREIEPATAVAMGTVGTNPASEAAEAPLQGTQAPVHANAGWRTVGVETLLGGGWLLGVLALGTVLVVQWNRARRLVRLGNRTEDPRVAPLVQQLRCRLGVRRRVRVAVIAERIAPAVFGVFRPTVLLPEAVLDRSSPEELRALVAHELIHVRRLDIPAGMLQIAAQLVWWFNPLVWLANRRVCRERERCCDEEAVAALGCRPADYARSLLNVLEVKRGPALAYGTLGVRPVEVTAQRLEHIMQRAGEFRRRTPKWCWAAAAFAAMLVLPGRGLTLTAGAPKGEDLPTVATLASSLEGHTGTITSCAFSPDGSRLACGSGRAGVVGEVLIWDVASGKVKQSIRGHRDPITALVFAPDGSSVFTASSDGSVILWDTTKGEEKKRFKIHGGGYSLALTKDGTLLAVGCGDGTVRMWDTAAGEVKDLVVHSLGARVRGVALAPDGRTLATAADGTVKLWDRELGTSRRAFEGAGGDLIALSPDGTELATASSGAMVLRDATTGEVKQTVRANEGEITAIAFSPIGPIVAVAGAGGAVRLWSRSGKLLSTVTDGTPEEGITALAFSPQGGTLVAAGQGTAHLWTLSTPAEDEARRKNAAALERISDGYLRNRGTFPFFRCAFKLAVGGAANVDDAIANGPTINRLAAECVWLTDGPNVCYLRTVDEAALAASKKSMEHPSETGINGKRVVMAAIPLSALGILTDGKRMLRYSPGFVANIMGPNRIAELIDGLGAELTPWALGGMGISMNSNPGRWIVGGRYRFEGARVIDGRSYLVVSGGSSGETRKEYCFDPERGYLALRRDFEYAGGNRSLVRITDVRECSGGRWFPGRILSVQVQADGSVKRVQEIVVKALEVDKRPAPDEFTIDIRPDEEVVHVDNLRSFFRTQETERVGLADLAKLHERCQLQLERREREALERSR